MVSKWLLSGCQVVAKRLPSGCQVVAKRLPSGCQAVAKWLPNGCQVVAICWLLQVMLQIMLNSVNPSKKNNFINKESLHNLIEGYSNDSENIKKILCREQKC